MKFGKVSVLLGLWAVVVPGPPAPAGEGARKPTISVRPSKPEFIEGEPIAIQVSIANPGPEPIDLVASDESSPLDLDADPKTLKRAEPKRPMIYSIGGSFSHTIRPRWTHTTTTYLQKRFASPGPGRYQVRCRQRESIATGTPPPEVLNDWPIRRKPDSSLELDQVVRFSVRAATPAQFAAMVEDYRRRLVLPKPPLKTLVSRVHDIGKGLSAAARTEEGVQAASTMMAWLDEAYVRVGDLYPHRDEDFRVGEAIGGLSVITDKAVIPALADIIDKTDSPGAGFEALRRFADSPEAAQVVRRYLDTDHAPQALEWFYLTGQALRVEELGKLKSRGVNTAEYEATRR